MLFGHKEIPNIIIDAIVEHNFLNAKEIREAICRQMRQNVEPSTVYYNLNTLVKNSVLINMNGSYIFTLRFIDKVNRFASKLGKSTFREQYGDKIIEEVNRKKHIKMEFKSMIEYENLMSELTFGLLRKRNHIIHEYTWVYHYPYLLLPQGMEFLKYSENNHYRLTTFLSGKSPIDLESKKILETQGYKTHMVNQPHLEELNTEYCIWDAYVMKVKFRSEYLQKETQLISNCQNHKLSKAYISFLNGNHPFKIVVTLEKNASKAKKLIQKMRLLVS